MPNNKMIEILKATQEYQQQNLLTPFYSLREVIEHGRSYVGVNRPKRYRKRKAKCCFYNAAMLAIAGRGTYVEGFAYGFNVLIHHAWVTVDGLHAIDVTWNDPVDRLYFGIAFPVQALARHCIDADDFLVPLLSECKSSVALREVITGELQKTARQATAEPAADAVSRAQGGAHE